MLAPDISTMTSQMTDAYNSVVSMDGFSTSVMDLQVIKLQHDPDWLPPVRTELDALRTQAGIWNAKRPDVWAPFLVAVSNYVSTFQSVASAGKNDLDTATWLELLGPLLTTLDDINTKLQSAETEFSDLRGQIAAILPSIDKSIQAGWTALGQEEAEMEDLATQLGNLSAQATAANQKIDSDAISQNKQIISTSVKMLYAVASAGAEASIPILGIAVAVVTIGKGFYDLIEDADKLEGLMRDITAIQAKMTDEAQALALTKGTLQTLYEVEKQYLATRDAMPILIETWSNERQKVQDAIDALKAGASPSQYIDLIKIADAAKAWGSIETFTQNLESADVSLAPPVTFDIAKAKVTQAASLIA
jgi:hypothetical protein